tara:strand:+ start:31049 stop:31909 length:861 start_codon:yes stop_codon:yes gene_type:complete
MQSGRFSILIPSWNNLPYLKLCVESIRKHSAVNHEIILHLNEGSDGSREWADTENLLYTASDENVGICIALNRASELATTDFIVYLNDDMVALPGWDTALQETIEKIPHDRWFLSGTMIEPTASRNPCCIAPFNFGSGPEDYQEDTLLSQYAQLPKQDWTGANWPPNIVPRTLWEEVGGYSEEFSPGISSDPDFSRKLWEVGVRHFQGVAASRVYHFQSRSTGKVVRNDGRQQFLEKWGITQSTFTRCLIRLGRRWTGPLKDPLPTPKFLFYLAKSKWRLRRLRRS